MPNVDKVYEMRESLDKICKVPDSIISVYTLEQHVWVDSEESPNRVSRAKRMPMQQTVKEFQFNPVRSFFNDILRLMAAPYRPERRDEPIGQGYWIQAEFGSGKSHLLCSLATLALGDESLWELVRQKEEQAGRGKRDSLYQFWEEGIQSKSSAGKKGIFVVVKTLVGSGGGTVGLAGDNQRLANYILDATREQLLLELGRNISLYPTELLADRFLKEDYERYRNDLKKFLRDRRFFEEDEFEDIDEFMRELQSNKAPEYKRSCGEKLWKFYDEYLKMRPHLETETEEVLKHMVDAVLAEGYSGFLLILDEVSLFMKNRSDEQRVDDEQTLVVLSNRLAKVHNLPLWTVCAAQQAIESKMGVKNIIANDRLKLVPLLGENENGYYDIVLARVREIIDPDAITNYYLYYKRGFTWPSTIGEEQFRHFFPFHQPALEVLRAITGELTTARSAIHFMHQTLKQQVKVRGDHLISLWQLFDETVNYEEDPSGVNAGLASIKTKRELEYKVYEACKRQIDGQTKGSLKVYRDKAVKTLQTLFLYHIAHTRQQGITPEEIANAVLIERSNEAGPQENIDHYENIAANLKKELRQVVETLDAENQSRYRFDPVFTGIDPRVEFQKARDEAEANEKMQDQAWNFLLSLSKWPVKTRQMTMDLANETKSLFYDVTDASMSYTKSQTLDIKWQGRQVTGTISMLDILRSARPSVPEIRSDETDYDFAIYISTRPVSVAQIDKVLQARNDPRILLWVPAALNVDEHRMLCDLAAYRKLISDSEGKDSEEAVTIVQWVANTLQTEIGKIVKIVDRAYARGQIDGSETRNMEFHVAGNLEGILTPVIGRALTVAYEAREIKFEPPFLFRKEEVVKVMNGIVKVGEIPRYAKPTGDVSAAQNFGYGLGIMKKGADRKLDISNNRFVQDMLAFIDTNLADEGQTMRIETLYKNFMGIGTPGYGLSRRMVQLYLLCLVQVGKIRISLGPKAGLQVTHIDYRTIKEIDFSARILDALVDIQKMEQPKNWETFRLFAEVLLGESIPATHDDTIIAPVRKKLNDLFEEEKKEAPRLVSKTHVLFEKLATVNPYEREIEQFNSFFTTANRDDIDKVLYSLQTVFGYEAFDTNLVEQSDVDDFSLRMQHYRDTQRFLTYDTELRTAFLYATYPLPDGRDLLRAQAMQHELVKKLQNLQPYIDSEVRLRTELIGSSAQRSIGETSTLFTLTTEYTTLYIHLHNTTLNQLDSKRSALEQLLKSQELAALKILEKINALQPDVSRTIGLVLRAASFSIFSCPNHSRASIEAQLKEQPEHICGLSFENYDAHLKKAELAVQEAQDTFDDAINRSMEVFLNPAIKDRLQQGVAEENIRGLLHCQTVEEVRKYLVEKSLANASITETINRYLKRIVVKKVRIADFKPSANIIEKEQIAALTHEFQVFLEQQLANIANNEHDDMLPMLQVE